MKFIHISDVHLGITPDKGRPWSKTRAAEVEETFDRILEIVEERKVDLLLVAGDLFHTPPKVADLDKLDSKLSRLTKARTVIIAGSRDRIEKDSPASGYEFRSNTVILPAGQFSNAYFEDINTCVTGFSYEKAEYTESFAAGIAPQQEGATNILLMYGGDSRHGGFDFKAISEAGFDYVALGQLRKPKHMVKNRMAYPGSPEPVSHVDTGKHGFIYGQIIKGETRIKWEPIAVREYVNLGLEIKPQYTGAQIVNVIKNQIDRMGIQNIYKIVLKGQKGKNVDIKTSDFPESYLIYDVVDNTTFDFNTDSLARDNYNNVIGRFISELNNKEDVVSKKALSYGLDAMIATGEK